MAEAIARARFVRIAPRKARLVADLIRGKKVSEARDTLRFVVKGGALYVGKVLASAVANAESIAAEQRKRINTDEYVVKTVLIDGAATIHRRGVAPRGRAVRIRKRTSHITLVISEN
ncbi:MAG TPA: 50S ribosomal protein L22 [Candidatus Hydrogenedentes bacterium]|nr:50S ribosomal protein L22 [Candidatus Hydrogenedentota bacterium]HOS03309.1 50S ribosomal protein L22 [Candidatus Hydrogenedentota bacterium]